MKLHKTVAGLAALTAIGLIASACGDDSSSSSSESTSSSATSKPSANLKGTLTASGATFPQAFYQEAIADFTAINKGVTINYGGGGSGKGRTDLQTQVVDFAGSDGLVAEADKAKYAGGEFLYFPTVSAPITASWSRANGPIVAPPAIEVRRVKVAFLANVDSLGALLAEVRKGVDERMLSVSEYQVAVSSDAAGYSMRVEMIFNLYFKKRDAAAAA